MIRGEVFNIGGGFSNSLSLLELFELLEKELDIQMKFEKLPWRQSDQKVFIADIGKIEKLIGWSPQINAKEGVSKMIEWCNVIN